MQLQFFFCLYRHSGTTLILCVHSVSRLGQALRTYSLATIWCIFSIALFNIASAGQCLSYWRWAILIVFWFLVVKMYLFYVYRCLACMSVCEPCVCLVFMEARREYLVSWNWGYTWFRTVTQSAGNHLPSKRIISTVTCWPLFSIVRTLCVTTCYFQG